MLPRYGFLPISSISRDLNKISRYCNRDIFIEQVFINVYFPECPPTGVQLDTGVDSKKSFCHSAWEGPSGI